MPINGAISWLSDKLYSDSLGSSYFEKFMFNDITAAIGDFVLVASADGLSSDTDDGCDAAQILALYENQENKRDPYRAKVQWYSRPSDLPTWCFNNVDAVNFSERELIEDHRPFDVDVSIETFRRKCHILKTYTDSDPEQLVDNTKDYQYVCRYRLTTLSKRKGQLEPVLEDERTSLPIATPLRRTLISSPLSRLSKTPDSATKKINRLSLSEQRSWSVSRNEGTKLLLKKAILTDHNGKYSPKTPNDTKKLSDSKIRNILMELKENSEDELPTLIISNDMKTPSKQRILRNDMKTPSKQHQITPTRRSNRSSIITKYYNEDSPTKTPDKSPRKRIISENSDDEFLPNCTPRTPRTPKTASTPRTPSSRTPVCRKLKMSVTKKINTSQLTPTLQKRSHPVQNDLFTKKNDSLPGREKQMDAILYFVRTRLLEGTSGCLYISGVPGTGKTATVCSALQLLKNEPKLPEFKLVEVNGMKIPSPRQAYVEIYKQLTGKCVSWKQACTLLEKRFTKANAQRTPTVLLVDELDALCTRKQDVLYDIMEWARHDSAHLAVLAVANAMDLPDQALPTRVASRVGLTRLTFQPYTHIELKRIITTRMSSVVNVSSDALELIARKVAAVSGDARRALELCNRTLEFASSVEAEAGLREVSQALAEATCSATVRAIQARAPAERLILRAIASEVDRTGSEETTLSRALTAAAAIVALDGRPYRSAPSVRAPTSTQALVICQRLTVSRLLLMKPRPGDPRIILNVSSDDVHYATKQIHVGE